MTKPTANRLYPWQREGYLKPKAQPLFDTIILPAKQPLGRYYAFRNQMKFDDGVYKTPADTNMSLCGQLGTPLEYDFRWMELHFERYERSAAKFAMRFIRVSFIFGHQTVWQRMCGAAWRPLIDCPKNPITNESAQVQAKAVADEFQKRGEFWPHYWTPVGDVYSPRRIDSVEAFQVEVDFSEPVLLNDPIHLKVVMQDVMYSPH
jgi:hypothetical protein